MTIESDIATALASYDVRETILGQYTRPRSRSIQHFVFDVHVEHAASTDVPTIVAALEAITGYCAVIAKLVSSWPNGELLYSRFEVEVLT